MKNIFRTVGFGLAIVAFSAINGFAQGNPCEDPFETKDGEYQKFKKALKLKPPAKTLSLEDLKTAEQVGTSFTSRYGACADLKPIIDYINGKLPAIKEEIIEKERFIKFNKGVTDKIWSDAFSAGKEIIAANQNKPISLDVAIVLSLIGYDQASEKNDSFNGDTVMLAETVIKKIDAGMTSEKYGAFGKYELKTKDYPDGKQNSLGWMNYIIGYIKTVRQDNKKDGLPYYYKAATKYNSVVKTYPDLFVTFGSHYLTELKKIDKERVRIFEENGKKENEQTLAMWDLEKGYFDRAIDAYARAYKLADAIEKAAKPEQKTAAKTYKDNLYKALGDIYKERFDKTDGLDAHIAAQLTKPMPDPATEVQPVKEVVPTTTTTSTTTTTTTKPTTDTTKPTTTPTNTTTKPTSNTTTTKPSSSTKPKKPVTKKKSGR